MSKRRASEHALQEALKTEIRWPTRGDLPFAEAAEPLENASIAKDGFTRLVLMTDGYKQAGDLMVARTLADASSRDFLVFPILFNYRHFIELSLKYLLATFGPTVSIRANWNSHNLATLWTSFAEMLNRFGTEDPDEADPVVAQIVLEFAKIDPGSYSNRYPVDRNGDEVPVTQTALDLVNLADVMDAVESYFTGCDGYLNDLVASAP